MTELCERLALYWQFPFVRYALVVGPMVALCASLLGTTLVLKRLSFIGDGLSHVAFGAMAVATALSLTNDMPLVLGVTALCAVLLLKGGRDAKIQGDAALSMLSVGSLAVGYLLMAISSRSPNLAGDVCATLFGSTSILTLGPRDLWISVVLSLAVSATFLLFHDKVFATTFDEEFARACGTDVGAWALLDAVVVATVIVLGMELVGSLLISALVVFPALSAMRVCKSFRSVTICSMILSVACAVVGMLIAIVAGTPVGATIVAADMTGFGACCIVGRLWRGRA